MSNDATIDELERRRLEIMVQVGPRDPRGRRCPLERELDRIRLQLLALRRQGRTS
jgi:hypothetical protein